MRALIAIFFALTLCGQEDLTSNREQVRVAFQKMQDRAKHKDDYLFQRRVQKREIEADGKIKSQTILTLRRDPWDDQLVTRVIAKEDKPLPPGEVARQEEKLRKLVIDMRKSPPKLRVEEETWMTEMPDALDFRKAGKELRHGRLVEIFDFTPHPGYKAKQSRARAFEKTRGKVWVDQQDKEISKMQVEVFDTINIGFGVLGKVEKGTHFEMERKKWDVGIWFEEWQKVRFEIRLMMVKSLRQEIETRWTNFSLRPPVKAIPGGI